MTERSLVFQSFPRLLSDMPRFALLTAALASCIIAQTTSYADPNTGITFAAYKDSTTGAQYGIAMPQASPPTDFIGQLIAPISNGTGWTSLSLSPGKSSNLMIAAWPNDQNIVSSFREATNYAAPYTPSGSSISRTSITKGTFVNETHYSYTFLCQGCLTVAPNFQGSNTISTAVGWSISTETLSEVADANGPLTYYNEGNDVFAVTFKNAQSSDFATWARQANPNYASPASSSNKSASPRPKPRHATRQAETATNRRRDENKAGAESRRSTLQARREARREARIIRKREEMARAAQEHHMQRVQNAKRNIALPFKPAFSPDTVRGDDYEAAQRFKASFLDEYYKHLMK